MSEFVRCLVKEIELFHRHNRVSKLSIETIFFGGGTPSVLPVSHLKLIVNSIEKHFDLSSLKEFTIECNPGTDFVRNLFEYKSIGINRISIGVQSFIPDELNFLTRIHSAREAIKSIESALKVFENVSIDLIFSIPNQTERSLEKTLEVVGKFNLKHIAAYSLIYEEGTKLFRQLNKGKILPHTEEMDYRFYKLICEALSSFGFKHYEVSNFAKPGFECQHNLRYWKCEEYVGLGPSAHSYFSNQRYWNFRSLPRYFESIQNDLLPVDGREILTPKEKIIEKIMLGLRAEGIIFDEFQNEFGIDLIHIAGDLFELWQDSKKAIFDSRKVTLTDDGYFVCDKLTLDLLNRVEKVIVKSSIPSPIQF